MGLKYCHLGVELALLATYDGHAVGMKHRGKPTAAEMGNRSLVVALLSRPSLPAGGLLHWALRLLEGAELLLATGMPLVVSAHCSPPRGQI